MRNNRRWAALMMAVSLALCGQGAGSVWAADSVKPDMRVETQNTDDADILFGVNQKAPVYRAGEKNQTLKIHLTSTKDIKNVTVTLDKESRWPFQANVLKSEICLGDIKKGSEKPAEVVYKNLTVLDNVKTENQILTFDITYTTLAKTEEGSEKEIVHTVKKQIRVTTLEKEVKKEPEKTPEKKPETRAPEEVLPDMDMSGGGFTNDFGGGGGSGETGESVPRVIITGFTTDPKVIKAGDNFKLTIHLKNTSKKTAVKNLLFDLDAPNAGDEATAAPAFLPASGSSSIYLDAIGANQQADIVILLNAKKDLTQKPYSVSLSMKYENSQAAQFESTGSLSIPVKQEARVELGKVELSDESVSVGNDVNATGSLYNMGRTKLYNLKARFEGKGISSEEQYLGNIDPGATAQIDLMLQGKSVSEGETPLKLILSWEDEDGKLQTMEKEDFHLSVTEAETETDPDLNDAITDGEKETSGKGRVGAILAGLAGLIALIVALVKKNKKKKQAMEEDELIDELDGSGEDEQL